MRPDDRRLRLWPHWRRALPELAPGPGNDWWGEQLPPDDWEREMVERIVRHYPKLTKAAALRDLRLIS